MSHQTATLRLTKSVMWTAVVAFVLALLLPVISTDRASAGAIIDRRIDMQSSAVSTETSYEIDFEIPTGSAVGSFRVEFCNEDPIPGAACNTTTAEGTNVPSLDADTGSAITVTNFAFGGSLGDTVDTADNCTAPALATTHTAGTNLTHFDVECGTGNQEVAVTTGEEFIHFTLNNVDNPSGGDSFYARIYVFASDDTPTAYAAGAPPLGLHEGGVALSTAAQIVISARVQESLTFTVGVDAAADDCTGIAGTAVDLGVLDSGQINLASTHGIAATPNTDVPCAEVTTNAANGVVVSYVGDNLNVGATVCTDANTDTETTPVSTDLCINRDDDADTGGAMAFGTEQWGLGVPAGQQTEGGSITSVMTTALPYDVDAANEYSYTPNAVTQIASHTSVLDQARMEVEVAGTAAITTPTGLYDTTLTFIATSTF